MNHSFTPSLIDKSKCQTCKYDLLAHSPMAHCESCPSISDCELIQTGDSQILMCANCQARELEIQSELNGRAEGTSFSGNEYDNRVTELVNRLSKELPLDARQFHVQEITSIVQIESELTEQGITGDEGAFKLAEIVAERLDTFKKNLFELKKIEAELKVDMITDQRYLNLLVPSLRKEYREKFAQFDLSYTPATPVLTPKVIKPRQSASDKAMESMARLLNVTVEEARRRMESAVKNTMGVECICQTAPGTCKVHPS